MITREIENRQDINELVNAFYATIRRDELLGPIFNHHIKEEMWPVHLDKLTDFWETNLFGIPKFKGSPSQKHTAVDKHMNHGIEPAHFEHWLRLWHATIDSLYTGELALKAKLSAQKMANGQYMVIWSHRPENRKNH
ncbi:MAG: group III truncated hemoglobin [Cyclobacteriaceae bacterium]